MKTVSLERGQLASCLSFPPPRPLIPRTSSASLDAQQSLVRLARATKNKEQNAPPPRGGTGRAFPCAHLSTRGRRTLLQRRRRCRRRAPLRPSSRGVEAVGEALGRALGAQMESAEERCNDSSPLSAARKKRRIGDEGQSASFSKFFKCFFPSISHLLSRLDYQSSWLFSSAFRPLHASSALALTQPWRRARQAQPPRSTFSRC